MPLNKSSAWSDSAVKSFLKKSTIPLRIATSSDNYPILCSIWYLLEESSGDLLCVSHKNSQLVSALEANNKCAFEIAPNDPPYLGVRGKAVVTLSENDAVDTLTKLINRYLGDTDSSLANWLLGRVDEEYLLRLSLVQLTSWDYTERMR